MNPSNTPPEKRFSWGLREEHINLLADFLFKLMTFFNIAQSRGLAEQTACLLTDLREQCERAGAADPLEGMPLFSRFEDKESSATDGTGRPGISMPLWIDDHPTLPRFEDEESPTTEASGT